MLEIVVSEDAVKRALGNLSSKSGVVISRAANRSVATGKKAFKEEATHIYNVKSGVVEQSAKIKKATAGKPFAKITFTSGHVNLAKWGGRRAPVTPGRPPKRTKKRPSPKVYKAMIENSGGRKPLDGSPKPFFRSGRILTRTSRDPRAPIRGVAAPAVSQILKNDDVIAHFERDTSKMFMNRLKQEITYELSK